MSVDVTMASDEDYLMEQESYDFMAADARSDANTIAAQALHDMEIPSNLSYSEMHMWVNVDDEPFVLGLTSYGVTSIDGVKTIDLPEIGVEVVAGDEIGSVQGESGEQPIICPVDGTIAFVNTAVLEDPQVIVDDPYEEGWLVKIEPTDDEPDLLDAEEYADLIVESQEVD